MIRKKSDYPLIATLAMTSGAGYFGKSNARTNCLELQD
jgi:hypothetical protein